MPSTAAEGPGRATRAGVLQGLLGAAGPPGRVFVDATGALVPLRGAPRGLVVTDPDLGALLRDLGAPVLGCAGGLDGVAPVGPARAPDPDAVAALRPDLIVTGSVDGAHDLPAELVARLQRIAPVVAVDLRRGPAAVADLRALLGGGQRPAAGPSLELRGPTVPAPRPRAPG